MQTIPITRTPITSPTTHDVSLAFMQSSVLGPKVGVVLLHVASEFKVSVDVFNTRSKKASYVFPRQVAQFLMHELLGLDDKGVAPWFGMHRTGVNYSFHAVRDRLDTDPAMAQKVMVLRRVIEGALARL